MSETVTLGYWHSHRYHRLSVKDFVEGFCGWSALVEMVNLAEPGRNQGFLSGLFETGGRASEVLALQKSNFQVLEKVVVVRQMPLFKRYKKLCESVDSQGRKHWVTERLDKKRQDFPISRAEPLAERLLQQISKSDNLLFPSPYKLGFPLSRFWAYKLVRNLDDKLSHELRRDLGLDRPFIKNNEKVKDCLNLWLHWFRAQRASQLVSDYGYEVIDLVDYFSWERGDTALRYARKGWRGLAAKMTNAQVNYT